jgi:hypothetical protein
VKMIATPSAASWRTTLNSVSHSDSDTAAAPAARRSKYRFERIDLDTPFVDARRRATASSSPSQPPCARIRANRQSPEFRPGADQSSRHAADAASPGRPSACKCGLIPLDRPDDRRHRRDETVPMPTDPVVTVFYHRADRPNGMPDNRRRKLVAGNPRSSCAILPAEDSRAIFT